MKKKRMTADDFANWESLTHAVVRRRFWWAFRSAKRGNSAGTFGPVFEYDDLVSEGNLALIDAWDLYDEDHQAAFQTYAYQAIYRRVRRFIDNNASLISGRGDEVPYCKEIDDYEEYDSPSIEVRDHAEEVCDTEWVEHCMKKLRDKMGIRNTQQLLRLIDGTPHQDVAKTLGVTGWWVSNLFDKWLVEAFAVLAHMEKEYDL